MAVVKAVSSRATIKRATDYITKDSKTTPELTYGIDCSPETAWTEMEAVKAAWGKEDGRSYKHYSLTYHAKENITHEQVLANAIKLAENTPAWKGHQILIAVHTDKPEKHAHIIVNSVNAENGHKLQWSKADLRDLKARSDDLCREQGLTITVKGKTFEGAEREETSGYTKEAHNLLKKAEAGEVQSYVQDIALAVMDCREKAGSRQEFVELMEAKGIRVDWTDKRKYITFTDTAREAAGEAKCKIRNSKLEQYYNIDFTKEGLEHEFEVNARGKAEQRRAAIQLVHGTPATAAREDNGAGTGQRQSATAAVRSAEDWEREFGVGNSSSGEEDSGAAIRAAKETAERAAAERAARDAAEAQRIAEQQRLAAERSREAASRSQGQKRGKPEKSYGGHER
jgi:hypothetical protein